MKITEVEDIEEAAAESEQDRRDHRELAGNVEELLKHEDAVGIAMAVRRLVDGGCDPIVVAKTMLIGTRPGGFVYELSSRAAALDRDEQAAELWLALAIRDGNAAAIATMLTAGAVWLATQFRIDKAMLAELVLHAARRDRRADRLGYGAVDIVDHEGIANRAWIVAAIDHAKLPAFAPLEYKPS